eukprot:TRINITY_DN3605_c0_g1_i1.p1 TRINITY_DN3605_c0_g1~~TRINITY_DN3605_c0_g1_i1.p1  ORF type:complete len:436 (-),score=94.22 TRINITY_DN3605_c0_g1_i1:990-2297(-)
MLQTIPMQFQLASSTAAYGRCALQSQATALAPGVLYGLENRAQIKEEDAYMPSLMTANTAESKVIPQSKPFSLNLASFPPKPLPVAVELVERPLESTIALNDTLSGAFRVKLSGSIESHASQVVKMCINEATSHKQIEPVIPGHAYSRVNGGVATFGQIPAVSNLPKTEANSTDAVSTYLRFVAYEGFGTQDQTIVGISRPTSAQVVANGNVRRDLLCRRVWSQVSNQSSTQVRLPWKSIESAILGQCKVLLGLGSRQIASSDLSGLTSVIRLDAKDSMDYRQFQTIIWERIYQFTRTLSMLLLPLWNQFFVFGIISRDDSQRILRSAAQTTESSQSAPRRTALIRFSESQVGSIVVGKCDTVAGRVSEVQWAKLDVQSLSSIGQLYSMLQNSQITHIVNTRGAAVPLADAFSSILKTSLPMPSHYTLFASPLAA